MNPTDGSDPRSPFPVLVTGASGNVGGALVEILKTRGRAFRAAGTRPEKLREMYGDVDTMALDLLRPETYAPALQGMKGVFLLRPPAVADTKRTLNVFLDEAVRQGIEHVVFLSLHGAERKRWVPHRAVEQHLEAGPLSWTLLRAGFFAQNLADAYADDLREGVIRLPAGRGKVAFVDVRDLAEVAANVFDDPAPHRHKAWSLTGGEAIDFDDVAQTLSESLGRPVRYQPISLPGYVLHLRRRQTPWMLTAIMSVLHRGLRKGEAETVDPTLERLLGRCPRTLREYVAAHRSTWA